MPDSPGPLGRTPTSRSCSLLDSLLATVPRVREFEVRGEMIRLGQLLKVAGIVDSGGEAKALIATGGVTVNGEPETRRGRQLHPGDVLAAGDQEVRLV
jgi:ribosome-associated protein